jgi:hypothetical protein
VNVAAAIRTDVVGAWTRCDPSFDLVRSPADGALADPDPLRE